MTDSRHPASAAATDFPAGVTTRRRLTVFVLWLAAMLLCAFFAWRTTFTTDLSAFLPQKPTKEQQVLLDQLRDGVISRLILIGLEGGDPAARAAVSKGMAHKLRGDPALAAVNNGEPVNAERDQAFLFGNRYLLSPAVTPQRFTPDGMRAAIAESIDLLASPAGMFVRPLLPRDPTGEIVQLFDQLNGGNRPMQRDGVWVSRDGKRTLLLAQTRTTGADTDGQQQAMERLRAAFDAAKKEQGETAAPVVLQMTGPGVFSVQSRDTIKAEVERLSVLSTVIIIALLLTVYRSFIALALGLLPVVTGALAGVVAVSLGFGMVHGITLGFGVTLIGEAVDYAIYLFVQSRQPGVGRDALAAEQDWIRRFWPTIMLGVLTSIVGFSTLLMSSFPGLAQLGLYSIAGLIAAAAATRYVLPALLPRDFRIRDVSGIGNVLAGLARRAPALRWAMLLLIVAACVSVVLHRNQLWNTELSSLSPVPQDAQQLDARLRADMGAPDVRYMVALNAASREEALVAAERIAARLAPLVDQGMLAAVESPSRYLPSMAMQRSRQAAIPDAGLDRLLREATAGLPVKPEVFAPFLQDAAAARTRAPLQRADLDGTSFALAVDSLMIERDGRWHALLPLTVGAKAPATALAADAVRRAIEASGQPGALFVDLKAESDNLYSGYLREAVLLSLGGLAAIVVLLGFTLRSASRLARVLLPLAGSVITVVGMLAAFGHRLTILHLIGLLLIVAVGSNYALFFAGRKKGKKAETEGATDADAGADVGAITPETITSLAFANLTTVVGFGLLGFAEVPVLQAIGITVGPGAVLALLYAAVFAERATTSRQSGPGTQEGLHA